jgi:hypothetical protein
MQNDVVGQPTLAVFTPLAEDRPPASLQVNVGPGCLDARISASLSVSGERTKDLA